MENKEKLTIYIDMDGVLCDYYNAHKKALKENPDIIYPQSQCGFFLNLKPINSALYVYKILSAKNNVYILTAPSVKNPWCYTEKRMWVERYLGMEAVENMIISPHKNLLKGDYLIDDQPSGRGQDKFEGELILFGSKEFPDWFTVYDYLKGIYVK